jgi:hypothetical protein
MAAAFSTEMTSVAEKAGPEGVRVSEMTDALGVRAFGAMALKFGIFLLLPVPILPQVLGAALAVSGLRLFGGATKLWLPGLGAIRLSHGQVQLIAKLSHSLFGWVENMPLPSLSAMTGAYGLKLCALAMTLAGVSALFGPPGLLICFGLVALGFGLMQEHGLYRLLGVALCLAGAAFTLTNLAGAIAGAPWASGWLVHQAAWLQSALHPEPKGLMPE